MRLHAVLPHLKAFGGVRRFLELGNVFVERGHDYSLVLPEGVPREQSWFPFQGDTVWAKGRIETDLVLIGDPPSFPMLKCFGCPKYVWVIAGGSFQSEYLKFRETAWLDRELAVTGPCPFSERPIRFLINNRCFREHYPGARLVEGGVNTSHFKPPNCRSLLRVGYYAGRGRTKGEQEIRRQLGDVPHLKLIPLQGYSNEMLRKMYQTLEFFVAWEERPGWSNTAAEALSCGVPVVTNGVNCEAFLDRVIRVDDLREFFTDPMREFSWEAVADRLTGIFIEDGLGPA